VAPDDLHQATEELDAETDPATGSVARRRRVVVAGHRGDASAARKGLVDPAADVRASALRAVARLDAVGPDDLCGGLSDAAPVVRRAAAEVAGHLLSVGVPPSDQERIAASLLLVLGDDDPLVVEAACWALGEHGTWAPGGEELANVALSHPDARCREAALGALGAIGDARGLHAVLHALDDKPTVRRRAAVALAAFEGPSVDEALQRCLQDRDWQVREAAETLLDMGPN